MQFEKQKVLKVQTKHIGFGVQIVVLCWVNILSVLDGIFAETADGKVLLFGFQQHLSNHIKHIDVDEKQRILHNACNRVAMVVNLQTSGNEEQFVIS
jgi:hypothetical protein